MKYHPAIRMDCNTCKNMDEFHTNIIFGEQSQTKRAHCTWLPFSHNTKVDTINLCC
jgi:hypothetical protein